MSWLRSSPLRSSFSKQRSRDSPPKDADPVACYDSFRKHWQQSHDIIRQSLPPRSQPSQDDVLGIVNHVDQMITLLLLELRDCSSSRQRHQAQRLQQRSLVVAAQLNAQCFPCLEYLLSENLLDTLYAWSLHTGRFGDAVRLEQLKLYELLVSHDSSLLAHEPVTRPLLRLLDACVDDIVPLEVQRKLVVLLNHVCVALVQNVELMGLFFRPSAQPLNSRFVIFTLLVPYVHREGGVGQQARDAMLLCMSLSNKNDEIGHHLAEESHICSLLATGLSGLYSVLPRTLDVESADWHRLTVDDINDLPPLTQLMNSLEFCNAVCQVAHPLVRKQLLEFIYRGFLVPVIGPALLQESVAMTWQEDVDSPMCRTTVQELVAATAYFDLFLRTVTEPGLLGPLLKFLLEENYDDNRILDHLIRRISSQVARLSMVTLALFETLVDLNCEDVMLELCLGALAPCSHVMLSQRCNLLHELDPFGRCAEKFLSLTPNCCQRQSAVPVATAAQINQQQQMLMNTNGRASLAGHSLYNNYYAYLRDARQKIASCQQACDEWSCKYENTGKADDYENWTGDTDDEDYEEEEEGDDDDDDDDDEDEDGDAQRLASNDAQTAAAAAAAQNHVLSRVLRRSSTDEKVDKILESFTGKGKLSLAQSKRSGERRQDLDDSMTNSSSSSSSSGGGSCSRLGPAERERLEADIAALLGEIVQVPSSGTPRNQQPESSVASMHLSLSVGDGSSGYESFAPCSAESTPLNDDYDELSCSTEQRPSSGDRAAVAAAAAAAVAGGKRRRRQGLHRLAPRNPGGLPAARDGRNVIHLDWRQRQQIAAHSDDTGGGGGGDGKPPSVGIFLDVLLKKLEYMTENSVYVNLHLTGLISRLAIYPQPLLQSFLLNHSLVFQPSIKSLFQILASLKNRIDGYLSKQQDDVVSVLTEHAKSFLINRESRLVNARKNMLERAAQFPSPKKQHNATAAELVVPSTRALPAAAAAAAAASGQKKKSFTLLPQMFKKATNNSLDMQTFDSLSIEEERDVAFQARLCQSSQSWESPSMTNRLQNIVLCAVVLGEWLKELAAITQEHTIVRWFNATANTEHFELPS